MIATTRKEKLLQAIRDSSSIDFIPVTREELFLAKILGMDVETPTPVLRKELLYQSIIDKTTPTMLLRKRIELFLAAAAGVDVTLPTAVTREEIFWSEIIENGESGTWLTVSGVAPLTLANALAHHIKSLTQTGKVAQASTPTPASPVDIVCNNGAVRMVDDELPAGYKRVLGFACDNDSMWEITDFHLRGSDTVRISFEISAACNVFGCYQGADADDNYDLYVSTTSGSKYLRYGNGAYLSYWSSSNLGQRFDVVYTPTGSQGMPQDSTWSALTFTSENDLLIGSTTLTGSSAKLKGKLYGNFEVDGRLKLIPCERVSDGVLGYYDTYGATFYEPYTGYDGAVSLGYDGSHYTLGVVGTPEVLTVQGKNVATYDKTLTVEGTSQGIVVPGENVSFVANGFVFEPNTRYTISVEVSGEDITVDAAGSLLIFYVDYSDGTSATFGITKDIADAGGRTAWTTASGKTVTDVHRWIKAARWTGGYITISDMQIEVGTSPTAYESYVTPQTASVENLLACDTYADAQEIISGVVKRNVGYYIFTGKETFSASTAYGKAVLLTSASTLWSANKDCTPVCTHFVGTPQRNSGTASEDDCFFNGSGHFYFRVADNDIATFKTWLAEQYAVGTPVIVLYRKASEASESATAQTLSTTAGTNTVSLTANVSSVSLECVYRGVE